MKQKIVIKKLQANPGLSNDIKEFGGTEQIDIPEGWNVIQLCATPLIKDGKTVQIAYTLLLNQLECDDVLESADEKQVEDLSKEEIMEDAENDENSVKGFFDDVAN